MSAFKRRTKQKDHGHSLSPQVRKSWKRRQMRLRRRRRIRRIAPITKQKEHGKKGQIYALVPPEASLSH
jgi:hypothetical protein